MDCILPSDALTFVDSRRLPRLFTPNTTKTCLKKQLQTPPRQTEKTPSDGLIPPATAKSAIIRPSFSNPAFHAALHTN